MENGGMSEKSFAATSVKYCCKDKDLLNKELVLLRIPNHVYLKA